MTSSQPPPVNLPGEYHEALYWKISENRWRTILMNVVALILFVLSVGLFLTWREFWRPAPFELIFFAPDIFWLIGAVFATLILHELVHGVAIRYFGARPKYGILWRGLMFYATAPGYAFKRNQYLVVALAPLIAGSAIFLFLLALPLNSNLAWTLTVCAASNFSGAVGDMWISLVVWRYPASARVLDEQDGMRIFTRV